MERLVWPAECPCFTVCWTGVLLLSGKNGTVRARHCMVVEVLHTALDKCTWLMWQQSCPMCPLAWLFGRVC